MLYIKRILMRMYFFYFRVLNVFKAYKNEPHHQKVSVSSSLFSVLNYQSQFGSTDQVCLHKQEI